MHWVGDEESGGDLSGEKFASLGDDFFEGGLSNDGDSFAEGISFSFEDRFPLDFVALFGREQNVWSDFQGFCHSSQREVRHSLFQCDPL